MIIRFDIPVQFYIIGKNPDSLDIQTSFYEKTCLCDMRIIGAEPLSFDTEQNETIYFKRTEKLEFTISEDLPEDTLQSLIEARAYKDIIEILRSTANRCLRAIRNFGMVPHIREIYGGEDENSEGILIHWNAMVSHDGEEWETIIPEQDRAKSLAFILRSWEQAPVGELNVVKWPEIEEAIQDDLPSPPEQEFTTNSREHLRLKNFRLAVLESIIGLEVVITRFLTEYLRTHKNFSNKRIKQFLAPEFGLTARLAGILDLTLDSKVLEKIDLEKVMAAVKWRNQVTHRTGHLPDGLSEDTIVECLDHVSALIDLLALQIQRISSSPETQKISNSMYEKHQLRPIIWVFRNHRILTAFILDPPFIQGFPSADKLKSIVSDLIRLLEQRDPRFIPEQHLNVQFFDFLPRKLRARWRKGSLENIPSD